MQDFDFTDNSDKFLMALDHAKQKALEEIGLVAEGYAAEKCPKDTGRLSLSISHDRDDDTAYIGTNVEYAAYVEMGTTRQDAQPYLQPAVQNHVAEYRQIAEKNLKGES